METLTVVLCTIAILMMNGYGFAQVPPVYLSLNGTSYTTQNVEITITSIGESDEDALICHTDDTTCCRGVDNPNGGGRGEWMFPGGTNVKSQQSQASQPTNFFRSRDHMLIRLHRRNNDMTVGNYCCVIPTNGGTTNTFCVQLLVPCPDLTAPDNGMILYSSESAKTRPSGSTATYNCSGGYFVSGDNVRTCQNNGTWTEKDTTCEEITCMNLIVPDNGRIVYSLKSSDVRTIDATYICDIGYYLIGDETRTCQNGTWSGVDLTCQVFDCSDPPDIQNGSISFTETTFMSTTTYTCVDGYTLSESEIITCLANGTWSTPPVCLAVNCENPPDIQNGSRSFTETTFLSTTTYTCVEGYALSGSEIITCLSTGSWSTPPVCLGPGITEFILRNTIYQNNSMVAISDIGEGENALLCTTELQSCCKPPNGKFYYPNNTEVMYSDNLLYRNRGDQVVRLNRRDNAHSPTGVYRCEIPDSNGVNKSLYINITAITCSALPDVTNGMIVYSSDTTEPFDFETTASYQCDHGYEIVGDNVMRTCGGNGSSPDGQWSGTTSVCSVTLNPSE